MPDDDQPHEGDRLRFEIGGLTYQLDRAPKKTGRARTVITITRGEDRLVDRVDLYAFRSREGLARRVADAFGLQLGDVMGHLAVIIDDVERAENSAPAQATPVMTPERETAARELLAAPDLLDRAAEAMTARGHVGEDSNKKIVYLVATSRLLAKPASAILRAESATGKSELLDRVTELLPEESVEFLSRITPHALYYAGADHLRHKVVVVDEAVGTMEADHALRTLQTKGLLRLALTVKGKTEAFTVHGPIALLSGTTSPDLNPENLSRCLALPLDESPEQTKRVQDSQRKAWAGKKATSVNIIVWQDAQRLLEAADVTIPYAERLTFPARTTGDRRDNAKLLTLVAAHALLHQVQRERDHAGRIIATKNDYAAIYTVLHPLVEGHVPDLSPRATVLFRALVAAERPTFTRREAAELSASSYMSVVRGIHELVAHELLREVGRQKPRVYEVVDSSLLGSAGRLTPPEALD